MTTAVSSSYQDSTDHSGDFFFPGLVGATHSALDIESSLTKERQKYISIVFRLSEAVSNYMTTRCARCKLQFTGPRSVIFSLMTMCFWVYLIGFETGFMNQGRVVSLIPLESM